ncbi:hypothetical protein Pcinc_015736 [Petrolisthes cinctipes]|uniref:THAP-type domain-containing protein n=1 Tax=Petrolisthes cinctipes TaxID=88211 RepID=A0AAE1FSS5_PETCI|nr:hypothetical protein Pcinc_015736 [Petrolisthes cinctipes]
MPQCVAWKCSNRSDHCKRDGKSFHTFPKDPKTRRKWIHSLRLKNFTPSAHTVVCGDHFEDICLDRTGQTTRLRKGSIPSMFDFPAHLLKKIKPRKPPRQRSCPASTSVIDALQPDADKENEVTITTKEPTCNLAFKKASNIVTVDHNYNVSSPLQLKRRLDLLINEMEATKKKLRTVQRKAQRQKEKNVSLMDIVKNLQEKKIDLRLMFKCITVLLLRCFPWSFT